MNRINNSYNTRQLPQKTRESIVFVPVRWAEIAVTTGLIFLHECGHAFAAILLYQNANPKIELSYLGGRCAYSPEKLSVLGNKVGASNAESLVSSAGPIVDIVAILSITKLTRSDRHAAQLMQLKAIGLSAYALSALFFCYPSHDFCSVWSKSGTLAYSLLTTCCLATTALVLRNATKPLKKYAAPSHTV